MSFYPEVDYRSPFDDDINHALLHHGHWTWCHHRSKWAESGDERHLQWMLDEVTIDNPPDNPLNAPPRALPLRERRDVRVALIAAWLALVVIWLVLILRS